MPKVNRAPAATVQGGPCYRCGGTERKASNRSCLHCSRKDSREQQAARRAANPEKYRQNARNWRSQSQDKLRRYYKAAGLEKKFALTQAQYDQMLVAQGGVCAICAKSCKSGRALAVDHCHTTGVIRGLLCMNCNNGLGRFVDSPALLLAAAEYLEKQSRG